MAVTGGDLKRSISRSHAKEATYQLYTEAGEKLRQAPRSEQEQVLSEYPRPHLVRTSYVCLNGYWKYGICAPDSKRRGSHEEISWDGEILVPFSPEAALSGVGRQLRPEQELWYGRKLPEELLTEASGRTEKGHLLLHFGAVDSWCRVYLNGHLLCTHEGGYTPFEAELTSFLNQEGDNWLTVQVRDASETAHQTVGKQRLARGGMYYTAQSGIWQTVWAEWVPETYIKRLCLTPYPDEGCVRMQATIGGDAANLTEVHLQVGENCAQIDADHLQQAFHSGNGELLLECPLSEVHLWTPEDPYLYEVTVTLTGLESVESYVGMRSFSIEKDEAGVPRFCLNHRPYFLNGVLDQGYWPDGLYTAPSDECLVQDILQMKKLGFRMLRKHGKVEPERWYYHCDRIGMLVWQDLVNGGEKPNPFFACYLPTVAPWIANKVSDHHYRLFGRMSAEGRRQWQWESAETIEVLRHVTSLAVWVLFNEAWGQFDAVENEALVRKMDPTRLIDAASGWYDQGGGDFCSEHNYFRKLRAKKDPRDRAFVLSEYGGYACHMTGHSYTDRIYGYRKYDTKEALGEALSELFEKQIPQLEREGLAGAVYTQVSDIEEEVNGILTYDRRICKYDRKK